jgi:hypothetical protein
VSEGRGPVGQDKGRPGKDNLAVDGLAVDGLAVDGLAVDGLECRVYNVPTG